MLFTTMCTRLSSRSADGRSPGTRARGWPSACGRCPRRRAGPPPPRAGVLGSVEGLDGGAQRAQVADGAIPVEPAVTLQRDARGIVAAVLQLLQPGQQDVLNRALSDVADDAAHGPGPLSLLCFDRGRRRIADVVRGTAAVVRLAALELVEQRSEDPSPLHLLRVTRLRDARVGERLATPAQLRRRRLAGSRQQLSHERSRDTGQRHRSARLPECAEPALEVELEDRLLADPG